MKEIHFQLLNLSPLKRTWGIIMEFDVSYITDAGVAKMINQDSACVEIADTPVGPVCMAVLCDGMGGIAMGEYASASVIREFQRWFEEIFPGSLENGIDLEEIRREWTQLLVRMDISLREYGGQRSMKLGTTATGMLFWKDKYLLIQSGDSRAYEIGNKTLQLSEDQSFVQQQINMGKLTREEARTHPKRNVLLDCVGGSRPSCPVSRLGKINRKAYYLLCSDGFIHETSEQELVHFLSPGRRRDEIRLQENLEQMVEMIKFRGEKDNITAIIIRVRVGSRLPFSRKRQNFEIRKKLLLTQESSKMQQVTTEAEE